jgi:prolyl-tRNA editing enzyme YbaK/EbsC (Cys-tRNA(Pro) deacylase)
MAVAAPLSSACLEPTNNTTRIARPRRSQLFKTHDGHLPTVKTSRRRARSSSKTAQHELSTGHCEIRQVSARNDPPGRHVAQYRSRGLAMSAESVRAFLASAAPDLEIVELPASSQTHTLSAAWGIRAAQIAKTLALSVGGRAVLAVVCGDSRLDNKKVKAVLGGKATMLAPEEAATITGHVLGGVCPLGLAMPMPIYCDVQLRAFDEVVPGAGSTHKALRIAPDRMAALSGAQWVDICVVTRQGPVDSSDGRR